MKAVGALFGAPEVPTPQPVKEEETKVDPGRGAELAEAVRRKRAIFARRGRTFLRTGGQTRGGVSVTRTGRGAE